MISFVLRLKMFSAQELVQRLFCSHTVAAPPSLSNTLASVESRNCHESLQIIWVSGVHDLLVADHGASNRVTCRRNHPNHAHSSRPSSLQWHQLFLFAGSFFTSLEPAKYTYRQKTKVRRCAWNVLACLHSCSDMRSLACPCSSDLNGCFRITTRRWLLFPRGNGSASRF